MADKVFVNGLKVQACVGCSRKERATSQLVVVDVVATVDMEKAVGSDTRADCVDYAQIHSIVSRLVETTQFKLLEVLAQRIGEEVLTLTFVRKVKVRLGKPFKLPGCEMVGIERTVRKEM